MAVKVLDVHPHRLTHVSDQIQHRDPCIEGACYYEISRAPNGALFPAGPKRTQILVNTRPHGMT